MLQPLDLFFQIRYRLIPIHDDLDQFLFAPLVVLGRLFHTPSLPDFSPFFNPLS